MAMRLGLTITGALATLLLLPAAPAVLAASFDCGKAQSPLEQAICSNVTLSRNDEILAKAYATALGGLSEAARAEVQRGQRDWLGFVGLSCTDDAQPVTTAFSAQQVDCLATAFGNRSRELEQSRMQQGWRFYPVSHFAVLDDPEREEWAGVATKELASLRIDDDVPAAVAFNAAMDEVDGSEDSLFSLDGDLRDEEVTTDSSISTTVAEVTGNRIGLEVTGYWFGHGAAHGNYSISYRHFLVEQQRWLETSDLFVDGDWQDELTTLAIDALNDTIEGGIWPDSEDSVREAVGDPGRWRFDTYGLVLRFQPYEVTAYAYGAPEVTIPWLQLAPHLADGYESRLLY